MFNRILIALGIRKKPVPDTQVVDKWYPHMKSGSTYGKVGPQSAMYVGGTRNGQIPPAPMPSQLPPKAPPPSKAFMSRNEARVKFGPDIETDPFYNTPLSVIHDSPPCEVFAGKGGEFSGAGASGSWDSPSSCSSDTSSSSSDSGSSSCGSD